MVSAVDNKIDTLVIKHISATRYSTAVTGLALLHLL